MAAVAAPILNMLSVVTFGNAPPLIDASGSLKDLAANATVAAISDKLESDWVVG